MEALLLACIYLTLTLVLIKGCITLHVVTVLSVFIELNSFVILWEWLSLSTCRSCVNQKVLLDSVSSVVLVFPPLCFSVPPSLVSPC